MSGVPPLEPLLWADGVNRRNADTGLNVHVLNPGGGGGAVTVADGADVALGTTTDLATASTVVGLLKNLKAALAGKLLVTADPITFAAAQHVIVDTAPSTAVTQGTSPWVTNDPGIPDTLGQKTMAGSTGVVIASDQTAVPVSGAVTVTDATQLPASLGQKAMAASLPVVLASDQASVPVAATLSAETVKVIGTVNPPPVTKGTQGATGFSVQNLKDAGRAQVLLSWEEMAGTAAAESALTNFTLGSRNAAALVAATNLQVSAGKTLRIQSVTIYVKTTAAATVLARFRIRQAAAVANTSPVIFDAVMTLPSATFAIGEGNQVSVPIPDGLEVAAGQQIAFTWLTSVNTSTVGMAIVGYEY